MHYTEKMLHLETRCVLLCLNISQPTNNESDLWTNTENSKNKRFLSETNSDHFVLQQFY